MKNISPRGPGNAICNRGSKRAQKQKLENLITFQPSQEELKRKRKVITHKRKT